MFKPQLLLSLFLLIVIRLPLFAHEDKKNTANKLFVSEYSSSEKQSLLVVHKEGLSALFVKKLLNFPKREKIQPLLEGVGFEYALDPLSRAIYFTMIQRHLSLNCLESNQSLWNEVFNNILDLSLYSKEAAEKLFEKSIFKNCHQPESLLIKNSPVNESLELQAAVESTGDFLSAFSTGTYLNSLNYVTFYDSHVFLKSESGVFQLNGSVYLTGYEDPAQYKTTNQFACDFGEYGADLGISLLSADASAILRLSNYQYIFDDVYGYENTLKFSKNFSKSTSVFVGYNRGVYGGEPYDEWRIGGSYKMGQRLKIKLK